MARAMADSIKEQLTRTDTAVEAIKNLILEQHLDPGSPLPGEATLAAELGVSRSSVREALGRLQALDIVNVRRGAGAYVGQMSWTPIVEMLTFRAVANSEGHQETLREIMQMRRILDVGLAKPICQAVKGTRQLGLHTLIDEMIATAKTGKYNIQLDFAFHDGLFALAGNSVARQIMQSLFQVYYQLAPRLTDIPASRLLSVAISHREMLEAAESGNIEKYISILLAHYRPFERSFIGLPN